MRRARGARRDAAAAKARDADRSRAAAAVHAPKRGLVRVPHRGADLPSRRRGAEALSDESPERRESARALVPSSSVATSAPAATSAHRVSTWTAAIDAREATPPTPARDAFRRGRVRAAEGAVWANPTRDVDCTSRPPRGETSPPTEHTSRLRGGDGARRRIIVATNLDGAPGYPLEASEDGEAKQAPRTLGKNQRRGCFHIQTSDVCRVFVPTHILIPIPRISSRTVTVTLHFSCPSSTTTTCRPCSVLMSFSSCVISCSSCSFFRWWLGTSSEKGNPPYARLSFAHFILSSTNRSSRSSSDMARAVPCSASSSALLILRDNLAPPRSAL